ncbi:hypothetical protein BRC87_11240 [Halobacteriales archaeon QS_4_66_20]|nr:MAG: hypothetical protein BRC87_11240 [Halobacteriales archaeon QS_4_66_20]
MVLEQVGTGGDLLASSVVLLLFLLVPLVVGLGMVHEGVKQFRIRQRVRDTPTETADAVAVGRTEVSGVARPAEQTCRAPFTDEECLYVQLLSDVSTWRFPPRNRAETCESTGLRVLPFHRVTSDSKWKISERSADADGGWELLDLGVSVSPFYVEDETGRVLVDPTRGAVSNPVVMDESYGVEVRPEHATTTVVEAGQEPPERIAAFLRDGREVAVEPVDTIDLVENADLTGRGDSADPATATDPIAAAESGTGDLAASAGGFDRFLADEVPVTAHRDRKYEQQVVPVGSSVYVFGNATPRSDASGTGGERLAIGPDPSTDLFLVSTAGEAELLPQFERSTRRLIALGLLLSAPAVGVIASILVA